MKKILTLIFVLIPLLSFAGNITLETSDYVIPHTKTIASLSVDSLDSEISGFRFVLALDETKYTFLSLKSGAYLDSCGWEYLNWEILHDQNLSYSIAPATALLEINGLASLNGSAPSCTVSMTKKELVQIELVVAIQDDWTHLECTSVPLPFYWRDCQDNLIYSQNIDTAYTVNEHYSYDSSGNTTTFPGYGINGANCDSVSEFTSLASLSLTNGVLDFLCADSSDPMGDINLDGKRFELADMLLFANYFTIGPIIFVQSPYPEASIAATDINLDGLTLSVADLVLGFKIMIGSEYIYSKTSVNPTQIDTKLINSNNNSQLSINSTNSLDAVYLKIVTDNKQVLSKSDFSFLPESAQLGSIGDTTTLLMVNFDGTPILESGENKLFESSNSNYRVTYFEAVDIYGQTSYNHKLAQLPQSFELFQNYPNPFNPTTSIKASLSEFSTWTLEIVSITGQTVRTFNGSAQGLIEIEWDGKDSQGNTSASGIYLYRFEANGNSASRKMLLLK